MPHRPRSDLPRLSGRPEETPSTAGRKNPTVFRRFFDLLERFDRPHENAARSTHAKSATPQNRGGRK